MLTGISFADVLFCSFDLDPMTEVDDEYWENADPELAFKQPEGKPSKIAFANCLSRLQRILAYASRTIVRGHDCFGYVSRPLTFLVVLNQQIQANTWLCWRGMGTAHRGRVGLRPEQMDRYRS